MPKRMGRQTDAVGSHRTEKKEQNNQTEEVGWWCKKSQSFSVDTADTNQEPSNDQELNESSRYHELH